MQTNHSMYPKFKWIKDKNVNKTFVDLSNRKKRTNSNCHQHFKSRILYSINMGIKFFPLDRRDLVWFSFNFLQNNHWQEASAGQAPAKEEHKAIKRKIGSSEQETVTQKSSKGESKDDTCAAALESGHMGAGGQKTLGESMPGKKGKQNKD